MNIKEIVTKNIQQLIDDSPPAKFSWQDSFYENIKYLSIDGRGKLGEIIVASILRKMKCDVSGDDDATDAQRGYDIISDTIKIEVKLATITISSGQFQHENLHAQRDYHGILFIDIAPNQVFLTAVKRDDVFWTKNSIKAQDKNQGSSKPKKTLHRRSNGDYKCDFTIKHILNNDIPKFRDFRTSEIKTTNDFMKIYNHLTGKN